MKHLIHFKRNSALFFSTLFAVTAVISCTQKSQVSDVLPEIDPAISIYANGSADHSKGNVPSLRNFLLARQNALIKLENVPSDQLQPLTLQARTTAEQRAGVRRIRIRGFQIVSDSGPDYAGYNLGPSSPESALAVLASDITDTYISQAALKGIQIDSLELEIANGRTTPDGGTPKRSINYFAYIVSPASDAELEDLRQAVEENSPLYNLVSKPQVVNGEIDYVQTPKEQIIPEGFQPGLRDYLKWKRNAYLYKQKQGAERRANPSAAPQQAPEAGNRIHVKVEGGTGVRRVHIRQFEILHDNPPYLAGNDLGPSAQEHQLGVLTSCITHIFEIQAAAREVTLDSLAISVKGNIDFRAGRPGFEDVPRFPHNITYTAHIKSPATYQDIVDLRDAVEAVCPIYNLLKNEQTIVGTIVRGRPVRVEHNYTYFNNDQIYLNQ